MPSTSKPIFMTASAAAEYLGVSTRTLRAWRQACQPPAYIQYNLRGPVIYEKTELDKFKQAHSYGA